MHHLSKLLLIAGTGRNTGKTTLACEIIKKFSTQFNITGVKISPHFHGGTESLQAVYKSESFNIYQETDLESSKDSSKMLAAGANCVFYLEVFDENLQEAFDELIKNIPEASAIVCESPALRKVLIPGVFIIVDHISQQNKKKEILNRKTEADLFIETDKKDIHVIIQKIFLSVKGWEVN